MAATNTTTLAGLQDYILAESIANFRLQAQLLGAVYSENAGGALTCRFQSMTVPNSASSHTEAGSQTATAITVSAQDANLAEYAIYAQVSKLGWGSPGSVQAVGRGLGGALARTFDNGVTSLFSSISTCPFSGSASGSLTFGDIQEAAARLDETGFTGEKIMVLHPRAWKLVAEDILDLAGGSKEAGANIMSTGFQANAGGVAFYVSPWVRTYTDHVSNEFYQNAMYFREAVGVGYREPLVDIEQQVVVSTWTVDVGGASYLAFKLITDGAAVRVETQKS
jgi:hypothetical protein